MENYQSNPDNFNDYLIQLGQNLHRQRQQCGEKQQTVAKAVGVSHSVISQVENGRYKSFKMELLNKLAEHFNIPPSDLLRNTNDSAG